MKDALDHSWQWFQLHSSQRMQLVNYFLVSVAVLSAAYASGLQADKPEVSAAVCVLGVVISLCFQLIDLRTRELIRLGESALADIEAVMKHQTGHASIELVQLAQSPATPLTSYRIVIRTLQLSTGLIFALGFVYAVWFL